jgi:thiaminase/transcriptional activator TenA
MQEHGSANPFYAEWIAMYTSNEFVEGAERLAHLLDALSFGLSSRDIDELETIFLTSSRYEYLFWEMSWNRGRMAV